MKFQRPDHFPRENPKFFESPNGNEIRTAAFFSLGGGGGPLGEILKYAENCPKILMILEFGANFF